MGTGEGTFFRVDADVFVEALFKHKGCIAVDAEEETLSFVIAHVLVEVAFHHE